MSPQMLTELRHALRRLRATPVVTLSAIACLSIGVWMTCIVSAVGGGFVRPDLQVYRSDRLVQLDEAGLYTIGGTSSGYFWHGRLTSRAVVDSLARSGLFSAIGFYDGPYTKSLADDRHLRRAVTLSSGMASVLRVRMALGRGFLPADDSVPAAIISHELWKSMFGSDSSVIGRSLRLKDRSGSIPIVGVMPEGFFFPRHDLRPDFYLSTSIPGSGILNFPVRQMLARLRDRDELEDVRDRVTLIAAGRVVGDRDELTQYWRSRYTRSAPPKLLPTPVKVTLDRYYNEPLSADMLRFLGLVIACGGIVVLIAAANVVNLLLVRGAGRRQEIAVRMALGANRRTIAMQLLVETGIVAGAGVLAGFLLAFWQWRLIDDGFDGRQFLGEIDVSGVIVAVAAGIVLTMLVGIWPALRATAFQLEAVLKDSRRSGIAGSPLDGLLGRLVAASTAATVVLLICFAMMLQGARSTGIGRPLDRNMVMSILTQDVRDPRTTRLATIQAAVDRLRTLPGVNDVVWGPALRSGEGMRLRMSTDSTPERQVAGVDVYPVSGDYFRSQQLPIVEGRAFSPAELRDRTSAVVISRALARALFGPGQAVGHRIRYRNEDDSTAVETTVVGVVDRQRGVKSDDRQIFRPYAATAMDHTPVLVRFKPGLKPDHALVHAALRTIPGLLSSEVVGEGGWSERNGTFIRYVRYGFAQFATIALALAMIGTYGIVAYSVVRRTHEIGVRMAVGADKARITRLVVEQGLKVTAVGIIGGTVLSQIAVRVLASVIGDLGTEYSTALIGVTAVVLAISTAACLVPALRAGRMNPLDALRAD
jgi:predicted permease